MPCPLHAAPGRFSVCCLLVHVSSLSPLQEPAVVMRRCALPRGEKTELGEGESAARRGRFVVGVSEACPVCGGQRELGKGEKEAAGARSDFGGRGVVRAAGATPCSFSHHPQSGPHPHLQCSTVSVHTVKKYGYYRPLVQGNGSTPTPLQPPPIAGSVASGRYN